MSSERVHLCDWLRPGVYLSLQLFPSAVGRCPNVCILGTERGEARTGLPALKLPTVITDGAEAGFFLPRLPGPAGGEETDRDRLLQMPSSPGSALPASRGSRGYRYGCVHRRVCTRVPAGLHPLLPAGGRGDGDLITASAKAP